MRVLEGTVVEEDADASMALPALPAAAAAAADGFHGGDGGCTAVALSVAGVYPTAHAAADALDSHIGPVHEKFLRERGPCAEAEAGISREQWHEEVIQRAVIEQGWHVQKVNHSNPRVEPAARPLKPQLSDGSKYLLFGVTNNDWSKCVGGRAVRQRLKYPDFPADAPSTDSAAWHHTVAIVNKRLVDHDVKEALSSLWLRPDNEPDPRRGYLRTLRKVWRLSKCSAADPASCKGSCCGGGGKAARKRPRGSQ